MPVSKGARKSTGRQGSALDTCGVEHLLHCCSHQNLLHMYQHGCGMQGDVLQSSPSHTGTARERWRGMELPQSCMLAWDTLGRFRGPPNTHCQRRGREGASKRSGPERKETTSGQQVPSLSAVTGNLRQLPMHKYKKCKQGSATVSTANRAPHHREAHQRPLLSRNVPSSSKSGGYALCW